MEYTREGQKGREMENKEFFINCDGMKVHAKLDFPEEERGQYPLLILFHGLTGHMEETHILTAAVAAKDMGFAVLRIEFYGHGKSDGAFEDHTVLIWLSQAMRIVDYARNLDFVSDIYLCGHSQGGFTAILTAGLMPDRIKGLIPMSPAMVIQDGARKGNMFGISYNPDNPPDRFPFLDGRFLNSNYMRAARIAPVDECIRNYHGTVLIIHGTGDEMVPYQYAKELEDKYRKNGNEVRLVSIENADHCYTHPGDLEQMKEALKQFLS